ncbi:MAG TPA: NapC/NirT family cytochrome c, partial [Terriglobales bacterium]|nr:NapC/NirT family cytochrome c [Terriglobales bacterium]
MNTEEPKPVHVTALTRIGLLFRNPISLAGAALVLVSLANILFLFLIDVLSEKPTPYIGILAYMVGPAFLILGLVVIPLGFWWDRRRRRAQRPGQALRYLRIDFDDPSQRGTIAFFFSFTIVFIMMSVVGSYQAYEFTDSVQFCGQLCHSVMNPEFTAYQLSPHARVPCVECHVGAGASWYVRSKLSGARQVIAVTFNTFPRPIPTPVHNLRPAPETCEECHWPRR